MGDIRDPLAREGILSAARFAFVKFPEANVARGKEKKKQRCTYYQPLYDFLPPRLLFSAGTSGRAIREELSVIGLSENITSYFTPAEPRPGARSISRSPGAIGFKHLARACNLSLLLLAPVVAVVIITVIGSHWCYTLISRVSLRKARASLRE